MRTPATVVTWNRGLGAPAALDVIASRIDAAKKLAGRRRDQADAPTGQEPVRVHVADAVAGCVGKAFDGPAHTRPGLVSHGAKMSKLPPNPMSK